MARAEVVSSRTRPPFGVLPLGARRGSYDDAIPDTRTLDTRVVHPDQQAFRSRGQCSPDRSQSRILRHSELHPVSRTPG